MAWYIALNKLENKTGMFVVIFEDVLGAVLAT